MSVCVCVCVSVCVGGGGSERFGCALGACYTLYKIESMQVRCVMRMVMCMEIFNLVSGWLEMWAFFFFFFFFPADLFIIRDLEHVQWRHELGDDS